MRSRIDKRRRLALSKSLRRQDPSDYHIGKDQLGDSAHPWPSCMMYTIALGCWDGHPHRVTAATRGRWPRRGHHSSGMHDRWRPYAREVQRRRLPDAAEQDPGPPYQDDAALGLRTVMPSEGYSRAEGRRAVNPHRRVRRPRLAGLRGSSADVRATEDYGDSRRTGGVFSPLSFFGPERALHLAASSQPS